MALVLLYTSLPPHDAVWPWTDSCSSLLGIYTWSECRVETSRDTTPAPVTQLQCPPCGLVSALASPPHSDCLEGRTVFDEIKSAFCVNTVPQKSRKHVFGSNSGLYVVAPRPTDLSGPLTPTSSRFPVTSVFSRRVEKHFLVWVLYISVHWFCTFLFILFLCI